MSSRGSINPKPCYRLRLYEQRNKLNLKCGAGPCRSRGRSQEVAGLSPRRDLKCSYCEVVRVAGSPIDLPCTGADSTEFALTNVPTLRTLICQNANQNSDFVLSKGNV
nr:hypothetical protein CFP56_16900 [Quercus suber]